jgi:ABC-type Fe3+ transport system permease subunit
MEQTAFFWSLMALSAALAGATSQSQTRARLLLAGAGAALAFVLALIIALSIRARGPLATFARLAASSGYAIPGAVLALGALALISASPITLTGTLALAALACFAGCIRRRRDA